MKKPTNPSGIDLANTLTNNSAQTSPALRLRLLDIHVIHVHHMEDQAVMVFAILSGNDSNKYPGSLTVPLRVVQELQLEAGDELTIMVQKTVSQHHIRKAKV